MILIVIIMYTICYEQHDIIYVHSIYNVHMSRHYGACEPSGHPGWPISWLGWPWAGYWQGKSLVSRVLAGHGQDYNSPD